MARRLTVSPPTIHGNRPDGTSGVDDLRADLKRLYPAIPAVPAVKATGFLTFVSNPADLATVTINGIVFTFKDTPAGATDVQRGASVDLSGFNLEAVLEASANAAISVASYDYDSVTNLLNISYDTPGTGGNAFTLASSSGAITRSAATLTGGTAAVPADNRAGIIKHFVGKQR